MCPLGPTTWLNARAQWVLPMPPQARYGLPPLQTGLPAGFSGQAVGAGSPGGCSVGAISLWLLVLSGAGGVGVQ